MRSDYCPVSKEPCQSLCDEPCSAQNKEMKLFGYFQYDIRLDAWVQNRINNKGVAFYTKVKKYE